MTMGLGLLKPRITMISLVVSGNEYITPLETDEGPSHSCHRLPTPGYKAFNFPMFPIKIIKEHYDLSR